MGRGDRPGELETLVLASAHRLGGETGTRIYEDLEERTGRDPTVPAVHATLRRLERKGLVRSRTGEPSPRGGRPQRYYSATPEGLEALAEARRVWRAVWADLDLSGTEGAR